MSSRAKKLLKLGILRNKDKEDEDPNKVHHSIQAELDENGQKEIIRDNESLLFVPSDDKLFEIIEGAQLIFENDRLATGNTVYELEGNGDFALDPDFESLKENGILTKEIDTEEEATGSVDPEQTIESLEESSIVTKERDSEEEGNENGGPDSELDEFRADQEDDADKTTASEADDAAEDFNGRKRKRMSKRAVNKKRRMAGQHYLGFSKPSGQKNTFHNVRRGERFVKARCKCIRKTHTKKCSTVKQIFQHFWRKTNWDQRE